MRRRRPRRQSGPGAAQSPGPDAELLDLARQVLHDHNIGVAVASDRGVIVFEYLHELGSGARCIECSDHWPCSMERLRLTVAYLDR